VENCTLSRHWNGRINLHSTLSLCFSHHNFS
jgi:hypothetical protein